MPPITRLLLIATIAIAGVLGRRAPQADAALTFRLPSLTKRAPAPPVIPPVAGPISIDPATGPARRLADPGAGPHVAADGRVVAGIVGGGAVDVAPRPMAVDRRTRWPRMRTSMLQRPAAPGRNGRAATVTARRRRCGSRSKRVAHDGVRTLWAPVARVPSGRVDVASKRRTSRPQRQVAASCSSVARPVADVRTPRRSSLSPTRSS